MISYSLPLKWFIKTIAKNYTVRCQNTVSKITLVITLSLNQAEQIIIFIIPLNLRFQIFSENWYASNPVCLLNNLISWLHHSKNARKHSQITIQPSVWKKACLESSMIEHLLSLSFSLLLSRQWLSWEK